MADEVSFTRSDFKIFYPSMLLLFQFDPSLKKKKKKTKAPISFEENTEPAKPADDDAEDENVPPKSEGEFYCDAIMKLLRM